MHGNDNLHLLQSNRYFRTGNLYLAAYLLAKGLDLVNVDASDPKRPMFVACDTSECRYRVDEFRHVRRAVVNAHRFAAAIETITAKLSGEPSSL